MKKKSQKKPVQLFVLNKNYWFFKQGDVFELRNKIHVSEFNITDYQVYNGVFFTYPHHNRRIHQTYMIPCDLLEPIGYL